MFGKSKRFLVTLFFIIELSQCLASSLEPLVPNRGDFTYQASLRTYWAYHYCGGAIISDRWVLTSATCVVYSFFEMGDVFAVLGGLDIYEGDSYPCDLVKKHERFNLGQFDYDIALLRTSSPILFDQFIQPIPYYKGTIESVIGNAVSIGWGKTWTNDGSTYQPLTYTSVTVHTRTGCSPIRQYNNTPSILPYTIICGNYPSLNTDEFGKPLATLDSRILLGINAGNSGDTYDRPDVYTGTGNVADWIFQNSNVDGVDSLW